MLRGLWVLGEPLPHALALAKALGTGYSHHRIPPPKLFSFSSTHSRFGNQIIQKEKDTKGESFTFPDLIISTNNDALSTSLYIKNLSQQKTRVVLLDCPQTSHQDLDLAIFPEHKLHPSSFLKRLRGVKKESNYVITKAFLHDITPELLKTQIRKNQLPFEIPAPKTKILSVFIGTPTSSAFFTPAQAESLAKSLISAKQVEDLEVAVMYAEQTNDQIYRVMENVFEKNPNLIYRWRREERHEPAYLALLAFSDYFLITADLLYTISEACSTGKSIDTLFAISTKGETSLFHQTLIASGYIKPFNGKFSKRYVPPLDELKTIALPRVQSLFSNSRNP